MKKRLQIRRANVKKNNRIFGIVTKPANRTKKKPTIQKAPTNRQKTKQALIKAGLHKSGPERKRLHAAMEQRVGYKIPKLSDTVSKPSRYTTKKRVIDYKVETKTIPGEKKLVGFRINHWGLNRGPVYKDGPSKTRVISKKAISERLAIKKQTKKRSGSERSGKDRTSHKTGTMKARKSRAKSRGMKVQKETRKKKNKKK